MQSTAWALAIGFALLVNNRGWAEEPGSAADRQFLRDMAETRNFSLGYPSLAQPLPDGSAVLFLRSGSRSAERRLYRFNVSTGEVRELIAPEQILKGSPETLSPEEKARRERMRITSSGFTSYTLSEDGSMALVTLSGRAFVLPSTGGDALEVAGPDSKKNAVLDARLSPDGRWTSFVRGGELWLAPSSGGAARQITSGATDDVSHAEAEFVAQEEMGRHTGYWWSPNSQSLLYEIADASSVEKIYESDPATPTRAPRVTRYPRPGKPNVEVALQLVTIGGQPIARVQWERRRYEYLAKVLWEKSSPLTLVVSTRDQRDVSLLAVNEKSGQTRELLHEHDPAWVNLDNTYEWLRDGSGFLWSTERQGAWQLELHAPDGKLVRALTRPQLGFHRLLHIDLKARTVVVTASPEPVDEQIYEISLEGAATVPITRGPELHSATYARDARTRVQVSHGTKTLTRAEVFRPDESIAGELPSIAEKPPFIGGAELTKVGKAPGWWTAMVRPRNFDPKKRYPVIVDVYGGPHSNIVSSQALSYVRAQWIADHGFFVVRVDGRGTPGRGRAWERAILNKFADVPLEDQVAALRELGARERAMDLERVGIVGHSFGGYMAALSVLKRPDVYRAAVASAPVVDWLDYDTTYTERYLGVPGPDFSVYEANSLLVYAKDLSRPLLIFHGTVDDNVHFNQSLKLADALFKAGKPFELVALAGQTHLLYEPSLTFRYWERIFNFFKRNL